MKNNMKTKMVAVLALSLLFSACEKELPNNKPGKEVAVRVRLMGITEGDEEDVTRSDSPKKQEIQVTSIGNGMLMEVQVEQDASALRAQQTPLPATSIFRVIALKHDSKTFISYGDFTGDGNLVAGSLHVPTNDKYDFVCYSYNTNSPLAAPTYKQDDDIADTETIPLLQTTNDLLWTKITKEVGDEAPELEILLKRKMARLKIVLDVSYNKWTLTSIGDLTLESVYSTGTVQLTDGAVEGAGVPALTSWLGSEYLWESNELLVAPKPSGSKMKVSVPIKSIFRQGLAAIPLAVSTSTFTAELKSGYSYKILIRMRVPIFARSNIYWDATTDAANPKLTFIPAATPPGTTDDTNKGYQGVFFKWGSLVGISPAQTGSSDNFTQYTPLYVPVVESILSTSSWRQTTGNAIKNSNDFPTVTEFWNGWTSSGQTATSEPTDIPYMDATFAHSDETTFGRGNTWLIDPERNVYDVYKGFRGDICQYLGETQTALAGYRLPISYEFGTHEVSSWDTNANVNGWKKGGGQYVNGNIAGYPNGRADLLVSTISSTFDTSKHSHAGTNSFTLPSAINITMEDVTFPASGIRNAYGGLLNAVGAGGYYWSGSADDTAGSTNVVKNSEAHLFFFNTTMASTESFVLRSAGLPVRCVKK
jgi:hypothetical protein